MRRLLMRGSEMQQLRVVIAFIDSLKFSRTDINQRNSETRYRLLVALKAKGFRVIGSSD